MKQIYLFNIVAWNYRKKKRVSGLQKGKFYRPSSVPEARKERSCQSNSASNIEWRAERSFHRPTFIRPANNCSKKRDHEQLFCWYKPIRLFCRSRCRHRRRCSSSLLLKRQERHNKGTLTALITTYRSHNKMDAIPNRTHEEKTVRAYNCNKIPQALPTGAIIYDRQEIALCHKIRIFIRFNILSFWFFIFLQPIKKGTSSFAICK